LSSKNNDDQNLDQGIGLKDFLIACINYEDEQSLIGYLRNAYIAFFENEFESIDTQEMIDQFCSEKDIDNAFVKKIMHAIDEDHSNTITAAEFIGSVVGQINDSYGQSNEKKFSVGKIIQELKWPSQVGEGETQPSPLEID
jgi:Ca2+-binding EF-hand superfamily protein